jgi:glyoxylase-like metal-dependent hydrolase (beta-lactamase superfamily II)
MWRILWPAVALAVAAIPAEAQLQAPETQVRTEKVADGVYVLFGNGGNVGVSAGADGVFIIDDQYAPMTPALSAAIAEISDSPVRFVINTHWHGDHTGGNENFGKMGAVVVAHDNVRARMSVPQAMEFFKRAVPASPPGALPVVTFNDSVSLHLNGDDVRVIHVADAHTDGDAIVHFRKANVIHAGDTFFNGWYPFIDADSGGSLAGLMRAIDTMLALSDEGTRIIAGHGPVSGKADLEAYRKMLVDTVTRIRSLRAEGRTVDEIVALAPNAADYDKTWATSFINPERYIRMICNLLDRE